MKKLFLLGVLCGLCLSGWAQGGVEKAASQTIGLEKKTALDLSARLHERVQETFMAAREAEMLSDVYLWTSPSEGYADNISYYNGKKQIVNSGEILTYFEPEELYLHAPTRLTRAEMPDYVLVKHNLEVRKWLLKYNALQREVMARLPEFEAAQVHVSHPASKDATWLAKQLTPQHQYLLLGEVHEMAAIPPKVIQIIQEIARRNAASDHPREIFLFTEFLSEQEEWDDEKMFSPFFEDMPIWHAAQQEGVRVIGLEPEFVEEIPDTAFRFDISTQQQDEVDNDLWVSVEGIRLRNERWLKTIRRYREEHPDALFIIYAGLGHVEYTKPYSLGNALAGPHTLVTLMYPDVATQSVIFHDWTQGKFFQRITRFDRADLSRLAGFDIGIRIPQFVQGKP